jgi:hypothetical protein
MGQQAWKDYWLLDTENGGWFNVHAPGESFRAKIQSRSYPWQENPKPIVLPYGLWERAEARHRESTPVKKRLTLDEKAAIDSIMWGRYWSHREVRKQWFSRTYGRGAMEAFDNDK